MCVLCVYTCVCIHMCVCVYVCIHVSVHASLFQKKFFALQWAVLQFGEIAHKRVHYYYKKERQREGKTGRKEDAVLWCPVAADTHF